MIIRKLCQWALILGPMLAVLLLTWRTYSAVQLLTDHPVQNFHTEIQMPDYTAEWYTAGDNGNPIKIVVNVDCDDTPEGKTCIGWFKEKVTEAQEAFPPLPK